MRRKQNPKLTADPDQDPIGADAHNKPTDP
jgi:hypothetical protein